MKIKMVPVFDLVTKDGEKETHFGIVFINHEGELVADVDGVKTGVQSLLDVGKLVLADAPVPPPKVKAGGMAVPSQVAGFGSK